MTEVEIFKQSLDVSKILMIITIVTAVVSITFSALSLAFQRSHNKRSVRPFCRITLIMEDDSILLILKNAGLGPMLIESIEMTDKLQEEPNKNAIIEKYINTEGLNIANLAENEHIILSANEERKIAKIKMNTNRDSSIIVEEESIIRKLRVHVKYRDIYDKKFESVI